MRPKRSVDISEVGDRTASSLGTHGEIQMGVQRSGGSHGSVASADGVGRVRVDEITRIAAD